MPQATLVIVNPRGARGAAGRRWARMEARTCECLGGAEVERTRGPGDAERLAREAVRAGVERVVVAGGDGTLNEVACGLLGAELGGYAELGLLPLGTGCDYARTLGVPRDADEALEVLRAGKSRPVDAGRIRFTGADGARRERFFLNVASLGVSPLAVERTQRIGPWLGARAAFALGTVSALAGYRARRVALRVDGVLVQDEALVLAAIAGGRYFGGGMHIAPGAAPDDARFEVICVAAMPALRLLVKLPKLYRGTHLADPVVRSFAGRRIEAEAPDGPVLLEADGELLGRLPAAVEMLPGALRVLAPAP